MFDMPDYKNVGRVITKLAHSYHFDDAAYDTGIDNDVLLETDLNELLLPELGLFMVASCLPRSWLT